MPDPQTDHTTPATTGAAERGDMDSKFDALRKLHELDGKILRLRKRRDMIPQRLRRLDDEIAHQQAVVDETHENLNETRSASHRFDLEIRTIEEGIKKLEQQLLGATTNKEYNTFLSEIASKKADLSKQEDQALASLSAIDELVDQHKSAEEDLQQMKAARNEEAGSVEGQVNEIDEEIAVLEAQRPALVEQVDPADLKIYERTAAKRGETALAAVVDGACQGCFMKVTPEVSNALKRGNALILCKTCSRILYLP